MVPADLTTSDAVELIRRDHPSIGRAHGRWIEDGWDNRVLEVTLETAERLIFRFPRDASFPSELELAILRGLRGKTNVAIPEPEYIGRSHRYIGYRRLDGVHLDFERYTSFDQAKRERLGADIAQFFLSLHRAFDPREFEALGLTRASFAKRFESELAVLTALPMLGLSEFAHAVIADYREVDRERGHDVVLFNDLHHENMLLDAEDRLRGVIDFGDVQFGDPHWEFRYFFWFNEDLLERALAAYRTFSRASLKVGRVRLFAIVQNLCDVAHSHRDPMSKVPRDTSEARVAAWIERGPSLWRDDL